MATEKPVQKQAAASSPENIDDYLQSNAYAEAALTKAKMDGLLLAVRARWAALAVICILLPIVNFNRETLYYYIFIVLFALIGWAQLRVGRLGQSRQELALIFCDLVLMTAITVLPNPMTSDTWPQAVQYRFEAFQFFYVFLAAATLAYSWRTVLAFGTWTAGLWTTGLILSWFFPRMRQDLAEALAGAWPDEPRLVQMLDPNSINFGWRIQEMVVFLIVAGILALTVRRSSDLLKSHAASERERTNLSRYFSPNVVAELSKNDDPLKTVRTQNVAVLFVDIFGFTQYASGRTPEQVIGTLREFHARMEQEVFRHGGTLDKYLGDGLMATFGTPFISALDASNALRCAQAMITAVDDINRTRQAKGEPEIKAGFGLHYGPVVLGDIGANRLEFAVIGNTVNVASRLEALTRDLKCRLVASDDLVVQLRREIEQSGELMSLLKQVPAQTIRGVENPMIVWTQSLH